MNQSPLPRNFFKDNPIKEISAARLTYLGMVTISFSDLQEEVNREIVSKMDKSRYENYLVEKEAIMNLNNAQDIVTFMRKIKDSVNTLLLME